MTTAFNKLFREFEQSFSSDGMRIYPKKPNIDALFDQEEHAIMTTKGVIHVLCHLETVGNDILPIFTFNTTNEAHHRAFIENKGFTTMQHMSHAMRSEHQRMMEQ